MWNQGFSVFSTIDVIKGYRILFTSQVNKLKVHEQAFIRMSPEARKLRKKKHAKSTEKSHHKESEANRMRSEVSYSGAPRRAAAKYKISRTFAKQMRQERSEKKYPRPIKPKDARSRAFFSQNFVFSFACYFLVTRTSELCCFLLGLFFFFFQEKNQRENLILR